MKICYLDAFSGISGDMTVGALADAGAPQESIISAMESLATGASLRFERVMRRGISATRFVVEGGGSSGHRHLAQIQRMICDAATLPCAAKEKACAVFQRLAEVEAGIHGIAAEKVHFHEVGAVDSIADIAGACHALELLGIEQVISSPLNVGGGVVETEHGTLPVPAPATAKLLEGRPVFTRGPEMELTTPTGAALAATLAAEFGPLPAMNLQATGFGAGSKDFATHANVLRVLIGEARRQREATVVSVIETNVDDSNPQVLGYAMERLLEAGALDVTLQPVLMKKNRQGTTMQVIAWPEEQEKFVKILFEETSTLGLRIHTAERRVQGRSVVVVETPYGKVSVKVSGSGFHPEYEDCKRLAREAGVPLRAVIAEANLAYLKEF